MSFIVQPVEAPSIFKIQENLNAGPRNKINFYVAQADILNYTQNASGDFFINIKQETGTLLNDSMSIGDVLDLSFEFQNSGTNYKATFVTIDDGAASVSLQFTSGFSNWTGYASGTTVYDLQIVKNANADFNIEAAISRLENAITPPNNIVTNVSASLTGSGINVNFTASGAPSGAIFWAIDPINGAAGSNTSSPISVLPGTTGTFTFEVAVTNAAGYSNVSSASNALTLDVPSTPTMGSAVAAGASGAQIYLTPGSSGWSGAIVTYYAISNPSGIIGSSTSLPVTVNGLTCGQPYTFIAYAENAAGLSGLTNASNSATPTPAIGQQEFISAGTFTWVAPAGVTTVSVVAVGPGGPQRGSQGGGAGGGLGWRNNVSVTPGTGYTVVVGTSTDSTFTGNAGVLTRGGAAQQTAPYEGGGGFTGDGGGNGGSRPGSGNDSSGGAGGYSGNGGNNGSNPALNSGGGAGGTTGSASAGGVGLLGQGADGVFSTSPNGSQFTGSGAYGAGQNRNGPNSATLQGAVRIIWGPNRAFPSTNTGNL